MSISRWIQCTNSDGCIKIVLCSHFVTNHKNKRYLLGQKK